MKIIVGMIPGFIEHLSLFECWLDIIRHHGKVHKKCKFLMACFSCEHCIFWHCHYKKVFYRLYHFLLTVVSGVTSTSLSKLSSKKFLPFCHIIIIIILINYWHCKKFLIIIWLFIIHSKWDMFSTLLYSPYDFYKKVASLVKIIFFILG